MTKAENQTPKLVWVKWFDASYQNDECTIEELSIGFILETSGFLICEDKESISIGHDWCEKKATWNHISHIPKVNFIEIVRFDVPRKRKICKSAA